MSKEIAIEVKNLSKNFRLPTEKSSSIKQVFVNWTRGVKGYKEQKVLRDISFKVEKGDFFGIVGRNGSGKSTLLKLISGIYQPDSGLIKINGSLVSFIELGVGFNAELTGRENVYLNGALLGFSVKEIDAMYDEIVNFAELHEFMDQKLKNYSSGMQVRLAFSCAIRAKSDILVLDEVLAVGDEAFQRKCNDYFYKVVSEKKTVILVTHSMESVRQFRNKALMLEEGKISAMGNPDEVSSRYSQMFQSEYIEQKAAEAESAEDNKKPDSEDNTVNDKKLSDVEIKSIQITQNNKSTKVVNFRQDFSINFDIAAEQNYEDLIMGLHLINQSGQNAFSTSTKTLKKFGLHKGDNHIKFSFQNIFPEGEYYLNLAIGFKKYTKFLVQDHGVSPFAIIGMDTAKYTPNGLSYPDVEIEVQ